MKNFTLVLFSLLLLTSGAMAQNIKVDGSVVDTNGQPVGFATAVVLRTDSSQVAAAVSDKDGVFSLSAPRGKYIFKVGCLGFEDYFGSIEIAASKKLDPIKLAPKTVDVGAVTVTAKYITREADRFVMNVAGSNEAIGNTAFDMLSKAPGVWISNETLSINGFSGTKVMVGERILDMPFDELKSYLNSIKAEDILKIEVIPITGADLDASAQGGMIKITLRKQRQDGIDGNVGMSYETDRMGGYFVSPSATLNYRSGKLSLYANGSYNNNMNNMSSVGVNTYTNSPMSVRYNTNFHEPGDYSRVKTGMIYDFTERKSFGAEVSYSGGGENGTTTSTADKFSAPNVLATRDLSVYRANDNVESIYATVNYIYKIDTTGKMIKIISEYNRRHPNGGTLYNTTTLDEILGTSKDSLYRNSNTSTYNIFTISTNIELPLDKRTTLKTGAKFNLNNMSSSQIYDEFYNDIWTINDQQSLHNKYNEYIGALYFIASTKFFDKLSVSAGLRGEYTYARPQTERINPSSVKPQVARQSYFKLFPNVSLAMPLNKKSSHMLSLNYSKTISRPSFWAINPFRMQLSEYSYIEGNPALKPTIRHNMTLTYILAQKYSLTLGAQIETNSIGQLSRVDETNPEVIATRFENMTGTKNFFTSVNIPLTLTKWWSATLNSTAMRQQVSYNDRSRSIFFYNVDGNTTITLPAKFAVEMSAYHQGKMLWGNMTAGPILFVNAAVKKRIAKDKVTLSVGVENIFDRLSDINPVINEPSFTQSLKMQQNFRSVKFSVRYNFRSGVKFKARQVEQGDSDTESRAAKQ